MSSLIRKLQRSQTVRVLLVFTWVPYIAIRCVGGPLTHGGCDVLPAASAPAHEHGAHHHEGADTSHHEHGPKPASGRTCCELTGKCNVKLMTPSAPAYSPIVVTILAPVVRVASPAPSRPHTRPVQAAHGPPTYLRLATLLI